MKLARPGGFRHISPPDYRLYPCSFEKNEDFSVDLYSFSIEEAWNSGAFEKFRSRLQGRCQDCELRDICMGGCPIVPQITLCDRKTRSI